MEEEKKEQEHELAHEPIQEHSPPKINLTEKIRKNPWMLSSLILGVLIVILLTGTFSGSLTGNAVSGDKAADNLMSYAELQGINVSVNSIKEESGLYIVDVDINGKATFVYLTKDGKNIVNGGLIPMIASSTDTNTQTTEVPKSEKPSVELYVFTYCPYGLQMEKAILPVVNLLGNKIDFKIRQIGAMHGDYEKVEAIRQLSIEALYPDKYLAYVSAFAGDTSIGSCDKGEVTCLTPKLNALYTKLGMDASKINAYMTSNGESLYNAEVTNAQSKGASGSPTLIINGVEVQASRSPEAVKGLICNAFNNVPSECNQTLSTSQASAGFGSGTSSSSSSASC